MGLTERLQVIATHKEPSNKHVLWLKDNTFRKWDGDGWVDIGGGNGTTDYKALKNKPLINGRVLEGNINLEIKGEKGDTGPKGEQGIQGIQGLTGKDGIGISKVEQIVYSNEDSGENIVRVTLEDGTFTDITILNGSKGTSEDDIQIINIELDEEYIKAYNEGSLNWDGVIRNPVPLMQLSTTIEAGKYTKVVANEKDVLIEGYSIAIQDNGIRYVALLGTDKVANTKFQIEKNLVIANLGNMTVLRMPLIYKLHINIKDDEITRQDPETFLAIKDILLNSISEGLYPYLQISRSYNIDESHLKGSYAYLVPSTSSDDINCLQFKTEDGSLYININDTTGVVESVKDYNMDPIMVYKAIDEAKNSVDSGEGSDGSLETYVFYANEELTEDKIEANKRAYEAAMSETPALYVISVYGDIIVPTKTYISREGNRYVRFGISLNDEIVNSEALNREYLDVFNTQIRFVEDGTFTIRKQFESRLAKVSMLDEVIAKVDEIPDRIANIPQGEMFNYVHIPFEDAPLDEEQLAENAASCTKWLEAYKNNEPLPILCWSAFPYGDGRMHVYGPSDGLLNFSISTTLGFGNDESLDNAELVAMLIVSGTLASSGEVELYMPLEEKSLTTINSFKTINGQSIFGEGDIEIQGGGNVEVDAELSEVSENAVSNKAVTMALAETEKVTAAALNELNERFEEYATKEDIAAALAERDEEINHIEDVLEATIIEDEEVAAAALVSLDKRVTNLEQNGGGGGGGDIYNVSFTIDPSTMELVMAYDVQPTFDFTLDENGNLIAII